MRRIRPLCCHPVNQIIAVENFVFDHSCALFQPSTLGFRNDNLWSNRVPLPPEWAMSPLPMIFVSPPPGSSCKIVAYFTCFGYLRALSTFCAFIHQFVIHIPHHDGSAFVALYASEVFKTFTCLAACTHRWHLAEAGGSISWTRSPPVLLRSTIKSHASS